MKLKEIRVRVFIFGNENGVWFEEMKVLGFC